MKLYYRELGEGKPMIILHGLFGSSDNWLSVGKVLAEEYKVYMLDQRNHGQSPHSEEHSYEAMAEDLKEFIETHGIQKPIVLGHSMGGKTAMTFAVKYPDLLEKLIVVDIAPRGYPVHHDVILEGLFSIHLDSLESRQEADQQLARFVPDLGTRQFLLKNLTRNSEGQFEWRINLKVINDTIQIIGKGMDKGLSESLPTLFIRGLKSHYIKDEDFDLIYQLFPGAQIESVVNAGHWVHAEKPQELISIVREFLQKT